MPLERLTSAELQTQPRGRQPHGEYVAFLASLRSGEGGRAVVAKEGVSKQSVKNRLTRAAQVVGVTIRYHRSSPADVVFEVTGRAP